VLVPTTIDFQLTVAIPVYRRVPSVVPDGIGGRPTTDQIGRHRTRQSGCRFRTENTAAIQQTVACCPFGLSTTTITTTTAVLPSDPATTILRAALPGITSAVLHATVPDPTAVLGPTLPNGF